MHMSPIRVAVLAAVAGIVVGAAAAGAPRTYPLDLDPIRLGNKALEEGRLGDAKANYMEAIAASYQTPKARYGLAEVAVREGAYLQAETFYREALTEKDSYAEARAGLGLLLLRLGRDVEASAEFSRALEEKANYWPAVYGTARLFLAQGAVAEAKSLLETGAGRRGIKEREDLYHHGLALHALAVGDVATAEREALAALAMVPVEPGYATLVARVYAERGAPTLAIEAYEKALAAPGMTPTAPVLHGLGLLYESVGRYNDAHDRLVAAVRTDSTFAPALKDLARLYRLAHEEEKAARVYLRYVTLEKRDVEALVGLAESCAAAGWFAQSREAARAAMTLDSTRVDVRAALVRSGLTNPDRAARAEAARVVASLPDSFPWTATEYAALGGYCVETRSYDEARRHLDRALRLEPGLAEAHFQLGLLALGTGQPDSAIVHLEHAVAADPQAPLYHLNLGIAHLQGRHTAEALEPLRRSLALNEELPVARLLLAQTLAVMDSVSAAEAEYRRVLDQDPANAKALRGLAFCYMRTSRFREAMETYRAATESEPTSADGWAGLGNAYLGLQDWSAAEDAFGAAAALDPENATMKKGVEILEKSRP
jgi:tetratricopeptide (TPR) repeat protein